MGKLMTPKELAAKIIPPRDRGGLNVTRERIETFVEKWALDGAGVFLREIQDRLAKQRARPDRRRGTSAGGPAAA